MTQEEDDLKRLEFIAESMNEGSVHFAIRRESSVVHLHTRRSGWAELPVKGNYELDDLRLLIDEAMGQVE